MFIKKYTVETEFNLPGLEEYSSYLADRLTELARDPLLSAEGFEELEELILEKASIEELIERARFKQENPEKSRFTFCWQLVEVGAPKPPSQPPLKAL